MTASRRSFDKDVEYKPLNARHEDIFKEVYHLKLLLITERPRGVHTMMGKNENAWCGYHKLHGNHMEDCHQLKRDLKILIQRGCLLSYVKDVGRQQGMRSSPKEDTSSWKSSRKKGKSTNKVRETRVTRHILNTIVGGFTGGGETNLSGKRHARAVMHI